MTDCVTVQVKETRKTECDSQSGMKKMAIGHHIGKCSLLMEWGSTGVTLFGFPGDRSHTVEKRENVRTKDRERHQQFVNLDESESRIYMIPTYCDPTVSCDPLLCH